MPSIQTETLNLLEWPRLCQHVATFAGTKLGATVVRQHPIPTTRADSDRLLAQTREVYELESRLTAGLKFTGIHDIGEALDRAERQGLLTTQVLLNIATTLAGARQLRRQIDSQDDLPILTDLVAELRTYPELEQEIHFCIDDRGDVTDRANPKLAAIREQQKRLRDDIYQRLQQLMQRHGTAIQEQVVTQRGDRFVIPVKATHKDVIPGIVHDASASGATLYVEPQRIIELGNRLRQLNRQEEREVEIVLRGLTEKVAAVVPDLEALLAIVTTLDVATARSRYSLWLRANPPRFLDHIEQEQVTLRQLRHPLLVWQEQQEQGVPVVPIDVVVQPHIRVVAITGPNTGGKTVSLKTLGLAMLMAKVGLFVPAREPVELPWFGEILADIGDEQSIEQSLSTFSGHIRRISRILAAIPPADAALAAADVTTPDLNRSALVPVGQAAPAESASYPTSAATVHDPNRAVGHPESALEPVPLTPHQQASASARALTANALVLLDEVGAGTDPTEGSALAIALLHHLADRAHLTVATTHFGELKALKYQDERFENASVEFDDVQLAPTYRLLWGIPGRSNALAIAQRLGLDTQILAEARSLNQVGGTEDVNQVIAGLEAQRKRQETKADETAKLLQQAEQLHNEVLRKASDLKRREQELKQQQEQAIQAAIAEAKGEIAAVIRRLQKGKPTAQQAQQATDQVNQIAARQLPSRQAQAKPKPGFRPAVGDRVRIPRLGQTAEVLTDPDDDQELTVRFGLMKMTVNLADVESLQGEKAELPPPKPAPPVNLPPPPPPMIRTDRNTIDLRGKRVSEAEPVLETEIAQANGYLWVIHGHGTGKLKQGVHEYLRQHPQVHKFEPAAQSDGGTGVTVVHLV